MATIINEKDGKYAKKKKQKRKQQEKRNYTSSPVEKMDSNQLERWRLKEISQAETDLKDWLGLCEQTIKEEIIKAQQVMKKKGLALMTELREAGQPHIDIINNKHREILQKRLEADREPVNLVDNLNNSDQNSTDTDNDSTNKPPDEEKTADTSQSIKEEEFPPLRFLSFKFDTSQLTKAVEEMNISITNEPQKEPLKASVVGKDADMLVEVRSRMDEKGYFWVHPVVNSESYALLLQMNYDIRRHWLTKSDWDTYDKLGIEPKVGDICCSHVQNDLKWYRTQITKLSSPRQASVHFLDFGYTADVPLDRILPYNKDYFPDHPYLAFCCSLFLEPEDGLKHQVRWDFGDMVKGNHLNCQVIDEIGEENGHTIWKVDLTLQNEKGTIVRHINQVIENKVSDLKNRQGDAIQFRDYRLTQDPNMFNKPKTANSSDANHEKSPIKKEAENSDEKVSKEVDEVVDSVDQMKALPDECYEQAEDTQTPPGDIATTQETMESNQAAEVVENKSDTSMEVESAINGTVGDESTESDSDDKLCDVFCERVVDSVLTKVVGQMTDLTDKSPTDGAFSLDIYAQKYVATLVNDSLNIIAGRSDVPTNGHKEEPAYDSEVITQDDPTVADDKESPVVVKTEPVGSPVKVLNGCSDQNTMVSAVSSSGEPEQYTCNWDLLEKEDLIPGSSIKIVVDGGRPLHIDGSFWGKYVRNQQQEVKFKELENILRQYGENSDVCRDYSLGLDVLVKFKLAWHRAKIDEVPAPDQKVKVRFLDSGISARINNTGVKHMPSGYFPSYQAVKLCLYGVEEFKLNKETQHLFGALVKDKVLKAQVVSTGSQNTKYLVKLYIEDQDRSINDIIREKELTKDPRKPRIHCPGSGTGSKTSSDCEEFMPVPGPMAYQPQVPREQLPRDGSMFGGPQVALVAPFRQNTTHFVPRPDVLMKDQLPPQVQMQMGGGLPPNMLIYNPHIPPPQLEPNMRRSQSPSPCQPDRPQSTESYSSWSQPDDVRQSTADPSAPSEPLWSESDPDAQMDISMWNETAQQPQQVQGGASGHQDRRWVRRDNDRPHRGRGFPDGRRDLDRQRDHERPRDRRNNRFNDRRRHGGNDSRWGGGNDNRRHGGRSADIECFNCKEKGHISRECPRRN